MALAREPLGVDGRGGVVARSSRAEHAERLEALVYLFRQRLRRCPVHALADAERARSLGRVEHVDVHGLGRWPIADHDVLGHVRVLVAFVHEHVE